MANSHISIQEELTQQVWGTLESGMSRWDFAGQPEANVDHRTSIPGSFANTTANHQDVGDTDTDTFHYCSEDEDFGDFRTAATPNDDESWVSICYDNFEDMTKGVADLAAYSDTSTFESFSNSDSTGSMPPSPLPRGYLRSTQALGAYMHPMDFASESSTFGDLSLFESPSLGEYAPLMEGDSGATSSAQARHGTSTERVMSLGKTAFSRLATARQGAGKQAKQAVATWKAGFVEKENEELASVVRTARTAPMVLKTRAAPPRDGRSKPIGEIGTSGIVAGHRLSESWMDEERRVWGA